jgi:AmpD protein
MDDCHFPRSRYWTALDPRYDIDMRSGLISPAHQRPSPNCDERPEGTAIDLVVLHGISLPPGQFGGGNIERFFLNELDHDQHPYFDEIRGLKVSAHLLIARDGELVQFVPFTKRAWHAGVSSFRGVGCCNDYSIGIELEGTDDCAYEPRQYRVLAGVLRSLIDALPALSLRRLAGHCDIAPRRKTDPGPAFDWLRLYDEVEGAKKP